MNPDVYLLQAVSFKDGRVAYEEEFSSPVQAYHQEKQLNDVLNHASFFTRIIRRGWNSNGLKIETLYSSRRPF